jgi:outer membrane lipoprotein-sorting protein
MHGQKGNRVAVYRLAVRGSLRAGRKKVSIVTRHRSVFLWGGALVLALMGTRAARADEKADTLLKEVETATKAVKTLTADLSMSENFKTPDGNEHTVKMAATLKLRKPNLARLDFSEGPFAKTIASDGKDVFTLVPGNRYQKTKVDAQGKNIDALWAAPVSMFFSGQFSLYGADSKPAATYAGKQTIEGTEYDVVQLSGAKPFAYTGKLYIAPSKLATRLEMETTPQAGGQAMKLDAALTNVKLNPPLTEAAFAYVPPRGATLYTQPSLDDYNKKLLAVGSVAPKFTLSAPTGGRVELAEALKGKKAVLVNFWFYG